MRQRRDGTTADELRGVGRRMTAARVALFEARDGDTRSLRRDSYAVLEPAGSLPRPRLLDRRGRGHPLDSVRPLFHRPQFLSTVIRPVRKDSHV
ncbi:hypothetical protein AB0D27_25675 [Streptomyces sp. NPDC048415]|uniref:hypothetical protein n=1 Tax=Streptomyces sp. NPDC048415 TaxID=3154822 RepID=UPI00343F1686